MNAIMNSITKGNEEALDFQIYDIEKCFDTLWLHEVINCLYESGLRNDKLPLLFLENNNAQVAVKSNGELSRRVSIKEIIMQGSVWGSICCVVLMDKLGKFAYNNPEMLFYYKNIVGTPPLQMVDDIMAIQSCSSKSLQMNTAINTFIDLEKLTLSNKKCHNIHIGKGKTECPVLKVSGVIMEKSDRETYLGDIIDKSAKATPNIEKRKAKGYGAINDILAIVNEIPLSHWKVQAGLHLRQAMLVNGTMFNSEAWHNIMDKDITPLEKVDEALLRQLLMGHSKTPLEALHLETNTIPIRYILKSRRIMYLHTILQRDANEMVRKVYEAQKSDPSPGDFCQLVSDDCKAIKLDIAEADIAKMSKQRFQTLVKSKIRDAALEYLNKLKQKHTKMDGLKYQKLQLQSYLSSPMFNNESRNLLFRLRTRTVSGIRSEYGGLYSDKSCPLGCGDEDTLENILTCKVLLSSHSSTQISVGDIKFQDIFSSDILKQKQVTEMYRQLLQTRNEMTSQPVARTGPMHCS